MRVIPSRSGPSEWLAIRPRAAGQPGTCGTETETLRLVAGAPCPAALTAVTEQVSVEPSSSDTVVYVAWVAPAIGVPSRFH